MSVLNDNIDQFTTDLLHINNVSRNRLIDIELNDASKVFFLTNSGFENIGGYVLSIIASRIGQPGTTALLHSSIDPAKEQRLGSDINTFEWTDGDGQRDPRALHKYIENVYKELSLKGNNPLFLTVGIVNWDVEVKKDEIKSVKTPFLIFPIRLIRTGGSNSPVFIEFIKDDVYINPCFIAKLRQLLGNRAVTMLEEFPLPENSESVDFPLDVDALCSRGIEYLESVEQYIDKQNSSGSTLFNFEKNTVAIAQYNHDELCMYYDIKRNKDRLLASELAERIFVRHDDFIKHKISEHSSQCVLPSDSIQDKIIERVLSGESLIIKGPPGTGKTLTITNMLASLLAEGKRVLLTSQKPAAMHEVVSKLPEQLRKFVLLLESETEDQASRVNPIDIRHDLGTLVSDAVAFKPDNKIHDDIVSGMNEKKAAKSTLNNYQELMFDKELVIGYTLYDALDILCKNDVDPVLFTDPQNALMLTRADYNELLTSVRRASECFSLLSNEHSIELCPWIPKFEPYDKEILSRAFDEYSKAANLVNSIFSKQDEMPDQLQSDSMLLSEFYAIADSKPGILQINAIVNELDDDKRRAVRKAYVDCAGRLEHESFDIKPNGSLCDDSLCSAVSSDKWDKGLLLSDFCRINNLWHVANEFTDETRLALFMKLLEKLKTTSKEMDRLESEVYSIFDRQSLSNEVALVIESAVQPFSAYGDGSLKPKPFDFKAKKLYAIIKKALLNANADFACVVKGVKSYDTLKRLDKQLDSEKNSFASKFNQAYSDDLFELISILSERSAATEMPIKNYIGGLSKYREKLLSIVNSVDYGDTVTVGDLLIYADNCCLRRNLYDVTKYACRGSSIALGENIFDDTVSKNITAVSYLMDNGADTAEKIYEILNLNNGSFVKNDITELKILMKGFGDRYFKSYYTSPLKLTLAQLKIFARESVDKEILFAASEYISILRSSNKVDLDRFFRPFENGRRHLSGYTFEDYFENSVFHLATTAVFKLLKDKMFGIGKQVSSTLNDYQCANEKTRKAMLSLIEQRCISRICASGSDYAFLSAERPQGETLRRLFKARGKEIIKLKKCFIMSPAAISVFFGTSDFDDFDVVIVDEASQMSPTAMMPALFRSKQVVLVGDEWQMPPVKHFASKNEHRIVSEDGDEIYMNPDTSVLGLALSNCAFPVEKLVCHYRSKTESLITFSQKRFYDYMRTFPTAVPKTETVGLRDVYVPGGFCDDAVNIEEAKRVVSELNRHFDIFYEDGVLSESIGVVAFGQKQLDAILDLVRRDKALQEKIDKALASFKDLPEKLIFFKTILTVQGQEADHLIISLTYGKNKQGNIVQSFGELNIGHGEGKLGECIFNVAVTRAKSSLTMIHSVKADEITNENVSFISDYLRVVERFDSNGDVQFVGDKIDSAPRGFIRQVAEYISTLGIPSDRIIINFGVTEGSVKIPIVILSEDKVSALLGVWCETAPSTKNEYIDHNIGYFSALESRGWQLQRIYIADWVDNRESVKKALEQKIKMYK